MTPFTPAKVELNYRNMNSSERIKRVFFEPWGLGDTIIAAAIYREQPENCAIACSSRWHSILEATLGDKISRKLISVNLPYTQRTKKNSFEGVLKQKNLMEVEEVLSIRGDLRDYFVARQIFPRSKINMSGWIAFIAGRSSIINSFYKRKFLQVENRYKAWSKLASIPYFQIEEAYSRKIISNSNKNKIIIHIGAYWKYRQYPHVKTLKITLINMGYDVRIISGLLDYLPYGIEENEVLRSSDTEIVNEFKNVEFAITNDSGPMHLAALIGCKTIAVARISDINQWLPPGSVSVKSKKMPHGYRPDPYYASDKTVDGWPAPDDLVKTLIDWKE